jgi:hypothetical protein
MFIPDSDHDILPILDPGSMGQKAPDPRSRIRNTASLYSPHKIISWVNHVGRIFWVAIPTLLPLLPFSRYVSSQLSLKPTFSARETYCFELFCVCMCSELRYTCPILRPSARM